jgi:alcohol dehydrogenase
LVVVVDRRLDRLQIVISFGADAAIAFTDGLSLRRDVSLLCEGEGADVALEMSGAIESVEAAPSLLRIGGRLVLIGSVFPSGLARWDPELLVRRLIRVTGVHNYRPEHLAEALAFLGEAPSHFPFSSLVSPPFPLERVDEAFELAQKGEHLRVAIKANCPLPRGAHSLPSRRS